MFQPNCSFGEVTWPCAGRTGANASATPSARAARRARPGAMRGMADPGAVGDVSMGHPPLPTQRYAGPRRRVEGRCAAASEHGCSAWAGAPRARGAVPSGAANAPACPGMMEHRGRHIRALRDRTPSPADCLWTTDARRGREGPGSRSACRAAVAVPGLWLHRRPPSAEGVPARAARAPAPSPERTGPSGNPEPAGTTGQAETTRGPLARPPSQPMVLSTPPSRRPIGAMGDVGVGVLREGDREVHVAAVDAALEPGAGREDRLRIAAILPDQAPEIAEAMAGAEQPECPLPEQQVLPGRLGARIGEGREVVAGGARDIELGDEPQ